MISVIVPIYGVEPYLPACVDSILAQSYSDFELILVDDGSPDACGRICDEYAANDPRIRVLHKPNGGLSDARNAGLDSARGAYITFIDSDDIVHRDYLLCLYDTLHKHNADISACAMQHILHDADCISEPVTGKHANQVLNRYQAMECIFLGDSRWPPVSAWAKLYKKEVFMDIRFPVGRLHEDTFTTYKAYFRANRIAVNFVAMYGYRVRGGSITNSAFRIGHMDVVDASREALDFVKVHCESLVPHAQYHLMMMSLMTINKMAVSRYWDASLMRSLKQNMYDKASMAEYGRLNYKQKVWIFLLWVSARAYCALYRWRAASVQRNK